MEPKIRLDGRRGRDAVAAWFGSETAQKYANVRAAFTPIASKLLRYFKDL
jgi:hypothetical protein